MNLFAPLNSLLTIRARTIKPAGATLPGIVLPLPKYHWYYVASCPDGTMVASLHLGEGIVPDGESQPWRIMRRDRMRTLLRPTVTGSEAAAIYQPGGSGVTGDYFRINEGDSPVGGFDVLGRGWRGGLLQHRETKERSLLLRGAGDPPNVYYMEPVTGASSHLSLAAALLLAYVLIEREVREGSWIKRPSGLPFP